MQKSNALVTALEMTCKDSIQLDPSAARFSRHGQDNPHHSGQHYRSSSGDSPQHSRTSKLVESPETASGVLVVGYRSFINRFRIIKLSLFRAASFVSLQHNQYSQLQQESSETHRASLAVAASTAAIHTERAMQ